MWAEAALESIRLVILDLQLIKVIFVIFIFICWKVIKAGIYMQSKNLFPHQFSTAFCLIASSC